MIAPMVKAYLVSRSGDRDRLLEALREIGVVHLEPVDPAKAVAEESTLAAVQRVARARQILAGIEQAGEKPDISVADAAVETLKIQRESAQLRSRLSVLHRQMRQLEAWGDVRLEQFERLGRAGIEVRFYAMSASQVEDVQAECVECVGPWGGKKVLVAVIDRTGEVELPEGAERVELPAQDRPAIRTEAAEINETLESHADRLSRLAHLTSAMEAEQKKLQTQADFMVAQRSGMTEEQLFAVQGWVPADRAEKLAPHLAEAHVAAAVTTSEPAEDDEPPTLIRYPKWARPIKGLFDILGTNPGYREYDLSPFFMIAMPIFAAMLIGDAGYGLIFLLAPAFFYRKLVSKAGKAKTHLIMVIGAATFIWGVLTGNYFGIAPSALQNAGGVWEAAGRFLAVLAPLWREDPVAAREILMKVSFLCGVTHLSVAHIRQVVGLFPDRRFLAELGWVAVLWGMLGIIWHLFFIGLDVTPRAVNFVMIIVGLAFAIGYTYPRAKIGKRVGLGLAASLLPLLGTFSDMMSYIRLMAVGLASYYIAAAFNDLGGQLAGAITWYAVLPVIVVLFGHLLNIGLAMIAIFAHGVRLNMLEFSNNAGVQWAGYSYEPFAKQRSKEI